eukprot:TRINITY_DN9621_c0_g1_i3.p2 TRINITY_DN9621_c0_g1~~TRINITY_DN9621_c0_g1_i3.p2  ORF type:complete len:100 (-),score=12.54 TRINITY_DN9621_c0_g1_i3:472-771(-)
MGRAARKNYSLVSSACPYNTNSAACLSIAGVVQRRTRNHITLHNWITVRPHTSRHLGAVMEVQSPLRRQAVITNGTAETSGFRAQRCFTTRIMPSWLTV